MKFFCRELNVDDINKIEKLFNQTYKRQRDHDYFKWSYFLNPEKLFSIGVFNGKQLVGMMTFSFRNINNKEKVIVLSDIIVAKEFRRKGLFGQMYSYACSIFPIKNYDQISFTNEEGRLALNSLQGFTNNLKIDNLALDLSNFKSRPLDTIVSKDIFFKSKLLYSDEYLLWRFNDNPVYDYQVYESQKLRIFTKIFIDPLNKNKFVDLVYLEPKMTILDTNQLNNLISEIISDCSKNKVKKITTWPTMSTDVTELLFSIGFISESVNRYLCSTKNFNHDSYTIFQADSEVY